METCPACIGPNPDCATCSGTGEVTVEVHAVFMEAAAAREALWGFRNEIDAALMGAATLGEAKAAVAALL